VFPEANDPDIPVLGPAPEEAEEDGDFPTDEEIEINSDGEEVEGNFVRADGERQFDPPLYRGSPITPGQSMMATLFRCRSSVLRCSSSGFTRSHRFALHY